MKTRMRFAKEKIMNKDGINHIKLDIIPPKAQEVRENERKKTAIVFLIDASSSMMESVILNNVETNIIYNNPFSAQSLYYRPNTYTTPEGYTYINTPQIGSSIHSLTHYPSSSAGESTRSKLYERITKIDYAIDATCNFLKMLSPGDMVGVISFNYGPWIEQALTEYKEEKLNTIAGNIRKITPRGMTNISDSILLAKKMFSDEIRREYNCKIILLSDGEANQGVATDVDGLGSIALDCMKSGVTVSSLGIGLEYNSATMNAIATCGGGLFYHIEDLSGLEDIFRSELKLSKTITAKNVTVTLEIPNPIEIGENMNGYPQNIRDGNIEVLLGDMNNDRSIIFEIRNNFVDDDIEFTMKVSYTSLTGKEKEVTRSAILKVAKTKEDLESATEDEEIVKEIFNLLKYNAIARSYEAYERGDVNAATHSVCSTLSYGESLSRGYSSGILASMDMIAELNDLQSSYTTGTISTSQAKDLYNKSVNAKRNNA